MSNPYQGQNYGEQPHGEGDQEPQQPAPSNNGADFGYNNPADAQSSQQTPDDAQHYDTNPQAQQPQYGEQPQPQYGQQWQQPQYGQPQYGQPSYEQQQYGQQTPQYANQNQWVPGSQIPQTPPRFDAQGNRFGTNPPLELPWYGINIGNAITRFFKKYATFSGRASRSEYWWAFLFNVLVSFGIAIIFSGFNDDLSTTLSGLWSLAVLVPSIAISVRRLHDANLSGWWYLLPFGLSLVGYVLLITTLIGGVLGTAFLANRSMSSAAIGTAAAGVIVPLLLAVLTLIASGIVSIVFMCLSSKAEGARFDKYPQQPNQMI